MTNIITTLKKSIEATGVSFVYAAEGDVNRALDFVLAFPCCFAYLVTSGTITDVNGEIKERLTAALWFAKLTDFDCDAIENEDLITDCKEKAFEWLTRERMAGNFASVTVNSTQRFYLHGDAIVTGFILNVTIEEAESYGACDLPPEPDPETTGA